MAEAVMEALRDIAYLASQAYSVEQRQRLDLLIQSTMTYIESHEQSVDD